MILYALSPFSSYGPSSDVGKSVRQWQNAIPKQNTSDISS
jgi:hypothetical protein